MLLVRTDFLLTLRELEEKISMLYDWQTDRPLGFLLCDYVCDDVFGQPNPFNIFIQVYSISSGIVLSGVLDRPSFEKLVLYSRIPVYLELYFRSPQDSGHILETVSPVPK